MPLSRTYSSTIRLSARPPAALDPYAVAFLLEVEDLEA